MPIKTLVCFNTQVIALISVKVNVYSVSDSAPLLA